MLYRYNIHQRESCSFTGSYWF